MLQQVGFEAWKNDIKRPISDSTNLYDHIKEFASILNHLHNSTTSELHLTDEQLDETLDVILPDFLYRACVKVTTNTQLCALQSFFSENKQAIIETAFEGHDAFLQKLIDGILLKLQASQITVFLYQFFTDPEVINYTIAEMKKREGNVSVSCIKISIIILVINRQDSSSQLYLEIIALLKYFLSKDPTPANCESFQDIIIYLNPFLSDHKLTSLFWKFSMFCLKSDIFKKAFLGAKILTLIQKNSNFCESVASQDDVLNYIINGHHVNVLRELTTVMSKIASAIHITNEQLDFLLASLISCDPSEIFVYSDILLESLIGADSTVSSAFIASLFECTLCDPIVVLLGKIGSCKLIYASKIIKFLFPYFDGEFSSTVHEAIKQILTKNQSLITTFLPLLPVKFLLQLCLKPDDYFQLQKRMTDEKVTDKSLWSTVLSKSTNVSYEAIEFLFSTFDNYDVRKEFYVSNQSKISRESATKLGQYLIGLNDNNNFSIILLIHQSIGLPDFDSYLFNVVIHDSSRDDLIFIITDYDYNTFIDTFLERFSSLNENEINNVISFIFSNISLQDECIDHRLLGFDDVLDAKNHNKKLIVNYNLGRYTFYVKKSLSNSEVLSSCVARYFGVSSDKIIAKSGSEYYISMKCNPGRVEFITQVLNKHSVQSLLIKFALEHSDACIINKIIRILNIMPPDEEFLSAIQDKDYLSKLLDEKTLPSHRALIIRHLIAIGISYNEIIEKYVDDSDTFSFLISSFVKNRELPLPSISVMASLLQSECKVLKIFAKMDQCDELLDNEDFVSYIITSLDEKHLPLVTEIINKNNSYKFFNKIAPLANKEIHFSLLSEIYDDRCDLIPILKASVDRPNDVSSILIKARTLPEESVSFVPILLSNLFGQMQSDVSSTLSIVNRVIEQYESAKQPALEVLLRHVNPTCKEYCFSPLSHTKSKYCGLRNMGSTCYINSIIQQLFDAKSFCSAFLRMKTDSEELQNLQKIFAELSLNAIDYVDTSAFCHTFSRFGEPLNCHLQGDAVEFYQVLIDKMPEEVTKPFKGKQITRITGPDGFVKEMSFDFFNLSISVDKDFNSEMKSLSNATVLKDYNDDGRKFDAKQISLIVDLPEVLVIQLNRFRFTSNGTREKINSPFEFPTEFNISDCIPSCESCEYSLSGIVSHVGTADTGHYTSTIKKESEWLCYNDSDVSPIELKDAPLAYMLFYRKKEIPNDCEIVIDPVLKKDLETAIDNVMLQQVLFDTSFFDLVFTIGDQSLLNRVYMFVFLHSIMACYIPKFNKYMSPDRAFFEKNKETLLDALKNAHAKIAESLVDVLTVMDSSEINHFLAEKMPMNEIRVVNYFEQILSSSSSDISPIIGKKLASFGADCRRANEIDLSLFIGIIQRNIDSLDNDTMHAILMNHKFIMQSNCHFNEYISLLQLAAEKEKIPKKFIFTLISNTTRNTFASLLKLINTQEELDIMVKQLSPEILSELVLEKLNNNDEAIISKCCQFPRTLLFPTIVSENAGTRRVLETSFLKIAPSIQPLNEYFSPNFVSQMPILPVHIDRSYNGYSNKPEEIERLKVFHGEILQFLEERKDQDWGDSMLTNIMRVMYWILIRTGIEDYGCIPELFLNLPLIHPDQNRLDMMNTIKQCKYLNNAWPDDEAILKVFLDDVYKNDSLTFFYFFVLIFVDIRESLYQSAFKHPNFVPLMKRLITNRVACQTVLYQFNSLPLNYIKNFCRCFTMCAESMIGMEEFKTFMMSCLPKMIWRKEDLSKLLALALKKKDAVLVAALAKYIDSCGICEDSQELNDALSEYVLGVKEPALPLLISIGKESVELAKVIVFALQEKADSVDDPMRLKKMVLTMSEFIDEEETANQLLDITLTLMEQSDSVVRQFLVPMTRLLKKKDYQYQQSWAEMVVGMINERFDPVSPGSVEESFVNAVKELNA